MTDFEKLQGQLDEHNDRLLAGQPSKEPEIPRETMLELAKWRAENVRRLAKE